MQIYPITAHGNGMRYWVVSNHEPRATACIAHSLQLTARTVCQRRRSWIKGLGKNPQKELTHSLFEVPFVRGHPTMTPGTQRNVGVYTRQYTPHVVCLQVFRQQHTKIGKRV